MGRNMGVHGRKHRKVPQSKIQCTTGWNRRRTINPDIFYLGTSKCFLIVLRDTILSYHPFVVVM
jgi:hypothetical protein